MVRTNSGQGVDKQILVRTRLVWYVQILVRTRLVRYVMIAQKQINKLWLGTFQIGKLIGSSSIIRAQVTDVGSWHYEIKDNKGGVLVPWVCRGRHGVGGGDCGRDSGGGGGVGGWWQVVIEMSGDGVEREGVMYNLQKRQKEEVWVGREVEVGKWWQVNRVEDWGRGRAMRNWVRGQGRSSTFHLAYF